MNKKKYGFVACLLLVIAVISLGATNIYIKQNKDRNEEHKLRVVTSFYPMYIAALNIVDGCESVELENLSEPQTGCLHDYQLTPEDMVLLSKADVFIVNGGGIESFLAETAKQYPDLRIIEAGAGIEMEGENAHLWMSLENYQSQVENMAAGLADAVSQKAEGSDGERRGGGKDSDDIDADRIRENAKAYCDKIQQLAKDYRDIKREGAAKAVLFHEAFEYMAGEWGVESSYILNLDEERQVSAGEAADVLEAVENGAGVILAERLYGEELAESIRRESGVKILYLDTCVRGKYEKDAYLNAMEDNLKRLKQEMP